MRTIDLIAFEWKLQFKRGAALSVLLAFALVLYYGGVAGKAERNERASAVAAHEESVSEAMAEWLEDLRQLERLGSEAEVPPATGSAMDVVFASSIPQQPLSDFAVGQSDLLPFAGEISLWDPDIRLFSNYEIADPVALALGSFDISKAVVLFLPLLLVVFCFDVIAADRDARRLGLTVAQGVSIRRLFWQRLMFRAAVVFTVLFITAVLVLLADGGQTSLVERLPAFGLWLLFACLYGGFWLMLIAFVASYNNSGEFNVLALLGLWAGLTLVIPAASSALAEVIYPSPSRLTYLAEAREIENETRLEESEVANQFMLDHPELLVDQESEIPAFVLSSFLVTSTVDEATRPIVASFEAALQNRENVLALFRYLSPAVAVHSLFNEIAGTSAQRHQRYLTQARQFKAAYAEMVGPNIVAKQRIGSEFFETIPDFEFAEESLSGRVVQSIGPLMLLVLLSMGMAGVVNRRLSKTSPIA
ncbi:MAG: DUF3526 domain-containing protein [Pseudomonadales bacterium]|nr:DUF3526 domain-containing protein [Pseudomonadales bacterium]MBL6817741.1 DUF3526 domain-containing protein [Pseudomonadales bacterium]